MKNLIRDVTEFHRAYDRPVGTSNFGDAEPGLLRTTLILEEAGEFRDAIVKDDAEGALDALGDLIYVAVGAAVTYGWDLEEAWRRIHAANMSKLGADGKPIIREDGKILKGPNFTPPDHTDLVAHNNGRT